MIDMDPLSKYYKKKRDNQKFSKYLLLWAILQMYSKFQGISLCPYWVYFYLWMVKLPEPKFTICSTSDEPIFWQHIETSNTVLGSTWVADNLLLSATALNIPDAKFIVSLDCHGQFSRSYTSQSSHPRLVWMHKASNLLRTKIIWAVGQKMGNIVPAVPDIAKTFDRLFGWWFVSSFSSRPVYNFENQTTESKVSHFPA